jgi:hypothetical protein
LYILLAANNNGLTCIHEFLPEHIKAKKTFPETSEKCPVFQKLSDGFIIYPLSAKPLEAPSANEYIGILPRKPQN